jgi:transcriptional regulator with GAF, ATPase, and Fis domain
VALMDEIRLAASRLLDALEGSADRVGTVMEFLRAQTVERPVVLLPPEGMPFDDIERLVIVEALTRANWVQKDAAALLAISPRIMRYKVKTHGLDVRRKPDGG